ncbi:MAG: sugar ABC transporter ATP-binding protein [Peptoniphilaceae bacterium]|nr:sugar ABC transporter ATP-binding protein [Peptoniphilaceae bacterium]MDY6086197.1 sugar ABC transporter ATP-binding protein [Peptoniphilaceae bacterium]
MKRLVVDDVSKSFGLTQALRHVSFDVNAGEVHALIGENGSGKSTLTNMLSGIYEKGEGRFFVDGEELKAQNQVDANRQGVSIIVQELGTLSGLTVAENIFLGHEATFTRYGVKNAKAMMRKAKELLESYGFTHIKPGDMIEHYSFEDRKLVELIKATYQKPKILIVDETTTALSHEYRQSLYEWMQKTVEWGGSVIFISHDLNEVLHVADAITVLRDGAYIDTVRAENVTEEDLKQLMVGRQLSGNYYRTDPDAAPAGDAALQVSGVAVAGQIHDISFTLHRGEILGIGGLSESGMHEIGRAVFGASRGRTGEVTVSDGTPIDAIPTAIQKGIAYASKDRDVESIILGSSIEENITLPSLDRLKAFGPLIDGRQGRKMAVENAERMSVKMNSVDQLVSTLSGGNKQKVVLARWIARDSDILVLDSPTRGIDIKVKQDIYNRMDAMRKEGKAILMISEELMELIGMCDRILMIKDGTINGEIQRSPEVNENSLIRMMV